MDISRVFSSGCVVVPAVGDIVLMALPCHGPASKLISVLPKVPIKPLQNQLSHRGSFLMAAIEQLNLAIAGMAEVNAYEKNKLPRNFEHAGKRRQ